MVDFNPSRSIPSGDIQRYRQEYKEGAQLLSKAITEYAKTEEGPKKDRFEDVMNKALDAMNQVAQALCRQELQKKQSHLEAEVQDYTNTGSPATLQKIQSDIADIQNSV